MKRFRTIFLFLALCTLPFFVKACPLCQAGATKRSQKAYNETIVLLASLPLIGGGGIFYWLYSKRKK
jgi:hypothetical protein